MNRSNDSGFTLLEVMVALAVVGILLVGLLQTLNYHLDVAAQHEARTVTTLLASQKLTETREEPVASEDDFGEPYPDYHFKTEIGSTKYPGVGYITVTVTGHGEREVLRELFRLKNSSITQSNDEAVEGATPGSTNDNTNENAKDNEAK